LLEEEPDSRCSSSSSLLSLSSGSPVSFFTGCLDSLVYYKRLLVSLIEPEGDSTRVEREKLNLECVEMLRKLEEVDPMRRARYVDLGTSSFFSALLSKTRAKPQ
jgi:hypothetical protein